MDSAIWETISDGGKDLIRRMLHIDPTHRITIQEVLNHRWLRVSVRFFCITTSILKVKSRCGFFLIDSIFFYDCEFYCI